MNCDEQCRDAILVGSHPINEEEAIRFAALQCQIGRGAYNEADLKANPIKFA